MSLLLILGQVMYYLYFWTKRYSSKATDLILANVTYGWVLIGSGQKFGLAWLAREIHIFSLVVGVVVQFGCSIVYLIINALKGHKQCQLQMIIIGD